MYNRSLLILPNNNIYNSMIKMKINNEQNQTTTYIITIKYTSSLHKS